MKFFYILLAVLPLALAIAKAQDTACRCAPNPCPETQPEVYANHVPGILINLILCESSHRFLNPNADHTSTV